MSSGRTFLGYRRADGRVGVRNHVVILPVDDLSNTAAEAWRRSSPAPWPSRTRTAGCSSARISTCTSGR